MARKPCSKKRSQCAPHSLSKSLVSNPRGWRWDSLSFHGRAKWYHHDWRCIRNARPPNSCLCSRIRRTHATLFQVAGGSLRDAQTQLGHSKMSTTLEIYTLPIPEQQRATVEKLSVLMANDGRNGQNAGVLEPKAEELPLASQQIQ